jgi:hypothetical protein
MSIVLVGPSATGAEGGYAPTDTSSLREIEQEVARRTGPFQLRTVQNPQPGEQGDIGSTTTTVSIPAVRSTMDLGGLTDMFVLRRGRLADGTHLPTTLPDATIINYDPADRIRLVRDYRPQQGVLEVDRPYLYATADDEEIELHHLDPEQELRPAVLAGLRRCFVVHRLPVSAVVPGPWSPVDLTAIAPWLLTRDQVYAVSIGGGAPAVGWRVEPYGGGLFLTMAEVAMGTSYVVNRRPAVAMVLPAFDGNGNGNGGNGSVSGDDWVIRAGNVGEPWHDEDRFAVPMDYAAAAGHIEAWRTARPRLTLVAQTDMWANQKEAAAEFTRVSTVFFDPPRYDTPLSLSSRRYLDSPLTNTP